MKENVTPPEDMEEEQFVYVCGGIRPLPVLPPEKEE